VPAPLPDKSNNNTTPDEATKLKEALEVRDEILETLDNVYGLVMDGPDMSDERVELLAALPEDDLLEIASLAEEYAENIRDYSRLAHKALREQESE